MNTTKTKKATSKATETKATETKAKKATSKATKATEKKATEKKATEKKITFAERRNTLMQEIELKDCIQYENEKTALNKVDSAMILHDNAIMLTLVSTETKKASRVLEIWLHIKRNDLCISKTLFDSITDTNAELKKYRKYIDTNAKGSKYLIKLDNDTITKDFTNLLIKAL